MEPFTIARNPLLAMVLWATPSLYGAVSIRPFVCLSRASIVAATFSWFAADRDDNGSHFLTRDPCDPSVN